MALVKFDQSLFYMKGYKIQIFPNDSQKNMIDKCIELNIFIYNWTIEQEINQYNLFKSGKSDKKFLTYFDLINKYTIFRHENEWCNVLLYGSACKSIFRAYNAFEMFFKNYTNFPKFKSKKHIRKASYGIRHDTMYFKDNMLRIEGLPRGDMIYTKWHSGFNNNINYYNPVITRDNYGNYYISFSLLERKPEYKNCTNVYENPIGIDINVKDRFVCSNGYRSGSPDLSRLKSRLKYADRRVQKDIKRKQEEARTKSLDYSSIPNSKRANKRLNKRRKIITKMANITENFIQNETNKIINMNPSMVIMENLVVKDIDKNKKVSKMITPCNFYRCAEVMSNKCNKYNIPFKVADKYYPSSQLCSNCGHKQKIYSSKIYRCPQCGIVIDRDLNAALNLKKLASE